MKIQDFKIGETFYASAGFEWLCTDKGSRIITAIMLDEEKDEAWFKGPPYALEEIVFDEHSMQACFQNVDNLLSERISKLEESSHPNFLAEDIFKMFKEKDRNYPRKKLLERDRVSTEGYVFHPYAAQKKNNQWIIKVFELFSREFLEVNEDEFVKMSLSTEEALSKRKAVVTNNK